MSFAVHPYFAQAYGTDAYGAQTYQCAGEECTVTGGGTTDPGQNPGTNPGENPGGNTGGNTGTVELGAPNTGFLFGDQSIFSPFSIVAILVGAVIIATVALAIKKSRRRANSNQ